MRVYSGSGVSGVAGAVDHHASYVGALFLTQSAALAAGTYTARAEQDDAAGNIGYSNTVTFTVGARRRGGGDGGGGGGGASDTTAPVVSLNAPPSSSTNTTPTFSGTAGTLTGDSSTVTVRVHSGSSVAGALVQSLTATRSSGGSYSADASPLGSGTYTARAQQSDAAGNVGYSPARTFTITGGAPPVSPPLPTRLPTSTGSTFYVATNGSDSNSGSAASPWRTVQKALDTLSPGQTAIVRAGTYTQNLEMRRSGTPSAPITIRGESGTRPVLRAGTGNQDNEALHFLSGAAYVRVQNVVIEGATGSSTTNVYADGNSHDIEISLCEIRGSQRQGFFSEASTGSYHVIGCYIHDNGGSGPTQQDHNLYLQGSGHLVASSLIARAPNGFGVQLYPSSDHVIVAGNTIVDSFRDGVIVGSGGSNTTTDALIVNNILSGNRVGVSTYWGGSVGSNNVARNNLSWGNSQGDFTGGGITFTANLLTNPLFVNSQSGDFHLQAASPALGAADAAYATLPDLDGIARPVGAGADLGAYER